MDTKVKTIILLLIANLFMTFAWYGHLKYFKNQALWLVILLSWGIALFEYCFQVPANRMGYGKFTLVELKTIQEVLTLLVFAGYSVLVMKENLQWNHLAGFACLVFAVYFIFKK